MAEMTQVIEVLLTDQSSLLFAATSAISIHGVMYYRRNGTLPGTTPDASDPSSIEAQTKDAFSSNPRDNEYDDDDGTHTERGGHRDDDEYALLHASNADEGRFDGRPMSWGREDPQGRGPHSDHDTSYHAGGAYDSHHAPGGPFNDDLALSHGHGGYASGGRLDFPEADYHR